jgi:ABC-2 type transport system ATP-binding protein
LGSIVTIHGLTKKYGTRSALSEINTSFEPGKFYALLGENGAGKSTFIRILMKFERPTKGDVEYFLKAASHAVDGPMEDSPDWRASVGLVSEEIQFRLRAPMSKVFKFYRSLYPSWDQRLVDLIVSQQKLDTRLPFLAFSRGQRMQLVFAVALAIQPKIIFVDEATAVMDSVSRASFVKLLSEYTRRGGTAVMATNLPTDLDRMADHLLILKSGELKADIKISEINQVYVKLRRLPEYAALVARPEFEGLQQAILNLFDEPHCVHVSKNGDGSDSFLMERKQLVEYLGQNIKGRSSFDDVIRLLEDRRSARLEELYLYVCRSGLSGLQTENQKGSKDAQAA